MTSERSRAYPALSAAVFAVVALAHLVRALNDVPVLVGESIVPVWVSWFAVLLAGALAGWGAVIAARR